MAKTKTRFFCQQCGYEAPKWLGRCPGCEAWNSFVEEVIQSGTEIRSNAASAKPVLLDSIELTSENRTPSGSQELDRVLGGGIVKGSFILVGGDPGIGKSTLLLQVVNHIAKQECVLYVSGEESPKQIKLRADRLGVKHGKLFLLSETNLDNILGVLDNIKPGLIVVDSIQTIYRNDVQSAPGSVSQIRECTALLMRVAKEKEIPIFLIGHVTKEGTLAGPRMLEHMVDTVLYFEGDRHHSYRILRSVKNRFGATNEIGVFEMVGQGLKEIVNPSDLFLSQTADNSVGAVVTCTMEGTRPLLVEVQALATPTGFGNPRRMATGIDYNRVSLLLAVLEKRVGLHLSQQDVFVNFAGGVKVDEPAVDLAVICAVASSFRDAPLTPKTVVLGEVGLTGEVRGIPQIETRVKEALKLGFKRCIVPKASLDTVLGIKGISIIGAASVQEALTAALEG
ncbi:MAG TPA: DNA repair protein RadA [Candidatus Deferrimicrobium sp.]|nr:DNA repair protein RadA [Candidatus Deferrimicrobium sp.]